METFELILSKILPIALTILVPTILVLVAFLSNKLSVNLSAQNKQLVEDSIMNIASQAIGYAEQIASNLAKKNEEIHGQDKLNIALDYAFQELKKTGLTDVASDELTRKIEALLGTRPVETVLSSTNNEEDTHETNS